MTGLEERDAAAGAIAKAPRVTLGHITSLISDEEYFVSKRKVTICVLTLKNGFKTTGVSAAVNEENFNEDLGRKIARDKALAEIWPLAGFLLQEETHRDRNPPVMRAKLKLNERKPSVQMDWGGKAKGRTEARQNSQGREYIWVDPDDPANYRQDGETLQFHAVCPPTCDPKGAPENLIFGEATPSASFYMHIRNPAVLAALELGREYYVDFIPAPNA